MSIHSGLTPSMTQEIQKIYDAETKHLDFMSWDGFFDAMEQLSKASPDKQLNMLGSLLILPKAPAYRYLTYALLELSEYSNLKLEPFREKAKQIFAQAEATQNVRTTAERYQQDLLHSLTDFVFDTLVHRGFAADARVHASLWDEKKTWTRKALCKTLFSAQPMTREAFLTLSLGLAFDVSFVQDYLKRVLRERELDIWDGKEVLVFVLLQHPSLSHPYADYRKLLDTYNKLAPVAVQSNTEQQQTQEINDVAEQMVYFLSGFRSVPLHSPEMETLLAQHKYLVEQQKQRVVNDTDEWRVRRKAMQGLTEKQKKSSAEQYKGFKEERAAIYAHLHTPDRLFCELRDSVVEKLEKIELPAASAYTTDVPIQRGTLGKHLYGFPCGEQLPDQEHSVSHEELIKFVRLLAPILEGKWLDSSRMTGISQGKRHIRRDELMTMAFLDRAIYAEYPSYEEQNEQGEIEDKRMGMAKLHLSRKSIHQSANTDDSFTDDLFMELASFRDYMNEILNEAGFDELYCNNPYDTLLMYLSVLDKPYSAYSFIFSLFIDMKKKKEINA